MAPLGRSFFLSERFWGKILAWVINDMMGVRSLHPRIGFWAAKTVGTGRGRGAPGVAGREGPGCGSINQSFRTLNELLSDCKGFEWLMVGCHPYLY